MKEVIWGYDPSALLPTPKTIGSDITIVKQLFSALLFQKGVSGIILNIGEYRGTPTLKISAHIDERMILQKSLSAPLENEYYFEFSNIIYPKNKLEIFIEVQGGTVDFPTSSIGNGMGFIQKDNRFVPTTHFPVGFVLVNA